MDRSSTRLWRFVMLLLLWLLFSSDRVHRLVQSSAVFFHVLSKLNPRVFLHVFLARVILFSVLLPADFCVGRYRSVIQSAESAHRAERKVMIMTP
uniref:Secreted protein n=1 Tax=Arundo donax TaxID=35708 RepID=A0A0A9DD51_ARUDO